MSSPPLDPVFTYIKSFGSNAQSSLRLSITGERVRGFGAISADVEMPASGAVPVYFNDSVVRGTASLTDIVKVPVREIAVRVCGRVRPLVSANKSSAPTNAAMVPNMTFLNLSDLLWPPKTRNGKVTLDGPGPHSWPFALALPASVSVGGGMQFTLPPSYAEPGKGVCIEYSVEVVVKRGGFLATDVVLATAFRYIPQIMALPFAAGMGSQLTAAVPTLPNWNKSSFSVAGTRFEVALPMSLTFARGTFIPFTLASNSDDIPELANPAAWSITLVRCTLLGATALRGELNYFEADGKAVLVDVIARASGLRLWRDAESSTGGWKMEGDVRIPRDTMLPFRFSVIAVYYALKISPNAQTIRQRAVKPHHVPLTIIEDFGATDGGASRGVGEEALPQYEA
ncbi:hypothetical protein DL93DRAFT_2170029 [Clavulina sp. PMI_390]|nr:hypothetical protein DL93DRAFT_2170029 [Clavulina sp. PMI_390]